MTTQRTTPLSGIIPLIHADLPKCLPALFTQKIREAAREFCRDTKAWRLELDPLTIQANVTEYDLDGWDPDESEMDEIISLKYVNGGDLVAGSDYTVPETGLLELLFTPGVREANALEVTISLIPTSTATTINADVYRQYSEIIADGARYMAMSMPQKPWTNPQLAGFFFNRYEAAKSNAKGRIWRGRAARPLTIRPRVTIV